MARTRKTTTTTGTSPDERLTDEERAALKERASEVKAARRRGGGPGPDREAAEQEVLAKIAEMDESDRELAGRVHAIVTAAAPDLVPRLWYGMPAYARDGKVLCHFQDARKF